MLNDDDEPLPKRLKIAQNSLNSVELIGINKEELILEWFTNKISKNYSDIEIWKSLKNCLTNNFINFRQTEINHKIIKKLIKNLSENLTKVSESDLKVLILECALIILRNSSFKQFFKHNLIISSYTNFIATVLKNINRKEDVLSVLGDRDIFDQKFYVKSESCESFVKKILPILFDIVLINEDEEIERGVVKLIQKVRNIELF